MRENLQDPPKTTGECLDTFAAQGLKPFFDKARSDFGDTAVVELVLPCKVRPLSEACALNQHGLPAGQPRKCLHRSPPNAALEC
jgi:hypothetical protein